MSETFGRTFSGGLTVDDLREAWLLLEPTLARRRIPQDLIDRLRRDWRRSDQGVRSVLATLKKMHRGGERGSDKSTLWDLTEAERGYVFTGRREPEPSQTMLPIEAGILLPLGDAGELVAALRAVEGVLRELVGLYRNPPWMTFGASAAGELPVSDGAVIPNDMGWNAGLAAAQAEALS